MTDRLQDSLATNALFKKIYLQVNESSLNISSE